MNFPDLRAVDGLSLSSEHRRLLRPGEPLSDSNGIVHHLPRFFFEVPSWEAAKEIQIAAHFRLSELTMVDCREAEFLLHGFPHHVPCAVAILARYLEAFRNEVGTSVYVSTNGGYRSPAHRSNLPGSVHPWGTAANVYRVGDSYLNDSKSIEKYGRIAESLGPDVCVRPYSEGDDHLHFDLGFATVTPRGCTEAPRGHDD